MEIIVVCMVPCITCNVYVFVGAVSIVELCICKYIIILEIF